MILTGIVSFLASVIGAISGIGGGIIIKPVLDMMGRMGTAQISFLSGCTVLAMTMISLGKSFARKEMVIDISYGTPLALGAAAGGTAGKILFSGAVEYFGDENKLGFIQALLLLFIIGGTALYMAAEKKVRTLHIHNKGACVIIGLILGMQSAFLGIGGGPANLVVLSYFFSMERKKASLNSLYIIFVSQVFSIAVSVLGKSVPVVSMGYLLCMILGGTAGGTVGSSLYRKMTSEHIGRMFMGVLILLLLIDVRNMMSY